MILHFKGVVWNIWNAHEHVLESLRNNPRKYRTGHCNVDVCCCFLLLLICARLKESEPRKSLDETDDADDSSDDEQSYETPEEKRKHINLKMCRWQIVNVLLISCIWIVNRATIGFWKKTKATLQWIWSIEIGQKINGRRWRGRRRWYQ